MIADFKARVAKYEGVSGKLRAEVFPAASEVQASEIHKHQKELATRIVQALPGWKQGEIFAPEIAGMALLVGSPVTGAVSLVTFAILVKARIAVEERALGRG